jgi:drug/metabolite transporter (DMT)-like permease
MDTVAVFCAIDELRSWPMPHSNWLHEFVPFIVKLLATHTDRKALACLIAGALGIGFAPIFVRLIDVGYTAAAFWRVALSLPVLWLLWYPQQERDPESGSTRLRWLWLMGVFFAADLAVWHQSIRFTSVANATLLANLSPVFVTAGSVWLFGDRINARFLAGLVLALTGSTVVVADSFTVSLQTVLGDCFGVIAAVFYSGYLLGISRLRRHASAVEVMWWSTLACAAALLPVVLLLGEPLWPQSARGWAVLLGLACVSQIAGQGLIAYALAHLPASFSSVSLLVQPVAAAVFAWVLLAEPFGAQQALGGVIVLAGIVVCRLTI